MRDQALGSRDILARRELHARFGMDPRVKPEDDEGASCAAAHALTYIKATFSTIPTIAPSAMTLEAKMDAQIKDKIQTLLDQHRIMTVATLRPDGWPQATTVGYVNDGLTLYFLCGLDSQKAANLARDDRLSLTIDHDAPQVMEITGLSMAARAQPVEDRAEAEKVLRMLPMKYPPQTSMPGPMPTPDQVCIFRVMPTVISVLDYSKGFGHTDLVTC
ncbi:pyridoxamine 5'-phosphate oxidase family protein [Mesorhizobium sp.]|uniref:pyridoxamine 5'-phosphate oxidase family protein n=2 Tax=Mesorhizobium sp. TaxID=1871066 RepID=UPI0025BA8073|nr:pyridoxamine 5'-phosphate oxidase family protein [Mesorhizobium sp.]